MSSTSIRDISIPIVLAFGLMVSIGISLYTFGQYSEAVMSDIRLLKISDEQLDGRLSRIETNLAALIETVHQVVQDRANVGVNAFSRTDCAELMMQLKIANPGIITPDCFALPEARRLTLDGARTADRLSKP